MLASTGTGRADIAVLGWTKTLPRNAPSVMNRLDVLLMRPNDHTVQDSDSEPPMVLINLGQLT